MKRAARIAQSLADSWAGGAVWLLTAWLAAIPPGWETAAMLAVGSLIALMVASALEPEEP